MSVPFGRPPPDKAPGDRVAWVKVFSAMKQGRRDALGDRITEWLQQNRNLTVRQAFVTSSSDKETHCLSIVLLGD